MNIVTIMKVMIRYHYYYTESAARMIYYVIIDNILHDFSIHVWYDLINNIVMAYVLL
jgi:hypothetical protein